MTSVNLLSRSLMAIAVAAHVPTVFAQDSSERLALEEVIVTAQKKEESIQDAPISIAAFSADDMEKFSITSLTDFNGRVPNFSMTPFPTSTSTVRLYMRGVGPNDVQLTQDPSVALYLNQVYIARSTGIALDVADLQRVEVLRGPQGTLYGRNATGGAVNMITVAPEPGEWGFKQTFTVGNYQRRTSKTSANLPMGDNAAVKLAYLYNTKNGYVKNDGPGDNFGDKTDRGLRLDFLWEVSDTFDVSYSYDQARIDFVNLPPQSEVSSLEGPPESISAISGFSSDRINHQNGRLDSYATASFMEASKNEIRGHALTLEWAPRDDFSIKYIGAYRSVKEKNYADLVASRIVGAVPYLLANGGDRVVNILADPLNNGQPATYDFTQAAFSPMKQAQVTHEINFFGNFNDNLSYTAGLYYFRETADESSPRAQQIILDDGANIPFPPFLVDLLVMNESSTRIENTAWSAFGELYFRPDILDQRLEFTFGYRHSQDKRKADRLQRQNSYLGGNNTYGNAAIPVDPVPGQGLVDVYINGNPEKSFIDNSFNFVTKYDVSDAANVYFKAAQGYKTGGFNTRAPTTEDFNRGFDPEKLISYEVGFKGDFFDRRMRLNTAVFYVDYQDKQMNLRIPDDPTLTQTLNAGVATISGFEADITTLITRDLTFTLNYGYLDARYDKVEQPVVGGGTVDVSDEFIFNNAPRHTVAASLDYYFPFVTVGDLLFNINYRFRSGTATTGQKNLAEYNGVKGSYINSYRIFDARLAWNQIPIGSNGGTLSFGLWGKNLLNEEYALDVYALPHTYRGVVWGEPKSYGLDMIYEF